jgi:hypothetical protein
MATQQSVTNVSNAGHLPAGSLSLAYPCFADLSAAEAVRFRRSAATATEGNTVSEAARLAGRKACASPIGRAKEGRPR